MNQRPFFVMVGPDQRRDTRMRLLTAIITMLAFAAPAYAADDWRSVAHSYDVERIDTVAAAIAQGNVEAKGNGSGYEQAVAKLLMAAPAGDIDTKAMVGKWQCRTIKVGGPFVGLVVYDWFKCRIDERTGSLTVTKVTGSQNFAGTLYADGPRRMVLLGGGYYGYEAPRAYQAADSVDGKSPDNRDKVATVEMLGPDWMRFVFPYPARESTYDIIEFRRDG